MAKVKISLKIVIYWKDVQGKLKQFIDATECNDIFLKRGHFKQIKHFLVEIKKCWIYHIER
jgi:hypothetical protein